MELARVLLEMERRDQTARSSLRGISSVDRENVVRVRSIVRRYGWPGRDRVGARAARSAWLVGLHGDHDPEFQRRCLRWARAEAKRGALTPTHVAYLVDRVAVNAGRPQIYGTQFRNLDGRLSLWPLWRPRTVESRRRRMGLCTLAAYERRMRSHARELAEKERALESVAR